MACGPQQAYPPPSATQSRSTKAGHINATSTSLLTDRVRANAPSKFDGCEGAYAAARHQNLVLQKRDRAANIVIEQICPVEAHREGLHLAQGTPDKGLCIADLSPEVVVSGGRGFIGCDVIVRKGVQQVDAGEPVRIAPEKSSAYAHRRNTRDVGAIGKRRTD